LADSDLKEKIRSGVTIKIILTRNKTMKNQIQKLIQNASKPSSQSLGFPLGPVIDSSMIQQRAELFSKLYEKQQQELKQKKKQEIEVSLPNGKIIKGLSWDLKPIDILKSSFPKNYLKEVIAAKVEYIDKKPEGIVSIEEEEVSKGNNFELYDLSRPLEASSKIEFLSFKDELGRKVFWHSSAHILGAVLEQEFGGYLCFGPPVEHGFYYDIYIGDERIQPSHFANLEKKIQELIKEDSPFQRIILSKEEALKMFQHNPFKVQHIKRKVADGALLSAYRCGPFVDLCHGPHIPSMSIIKAFKLLKVSQAYWLGDKNNVSLQRVYGISFQSQQELEEFLKWQESLERLDHKYIGQQQELFFFSPMSPGSAFYYPSGAKIYNKLIALIRKEYRFRNYQEVISPVVFNKHLWEISGHEQKFKDNMYSINIEKQEFCLKPMNCPGHCLLFDSLPRSYRDLPMRIADFGVLHRNEVSGALHGIVRARKFQQDDAHIFCRLDQVLDELMGAFDFMNYVYGLFGLEYKLVMSSRPENALGDPAIWDLAESIIKEALDKNGAPWEIAPGEGAFYGPKIEVHVKDARKRWFQCATMQVDFVLPQRFKLQYKAGDSGEKEEEEKEGKHKHEVVQRKKESEDDLKPGFQRPVIVHRAVLGSIERIYALLCEKYEGKWPFWLSPRQVKILPLSDKYVDYAEKVFNRLVYEGYDVELDRSNLKIAKKIRNAHLEHFNYVIVIGAEEQNDESVDLRDLHNDKRVGKFSMQKLLEFFKSLDVLPSEAELKLKAKSLFGKEVKI